MKDDLTPYQWQDHVITPHRAARNLISTALIAAVVGAAAVLGGHSADTTAHVALATERTPSLAHLVKRPAPPPLRVDVLGGC